MYDRSEVVGYDGVGGCGYDDSEVVGYDGVGCFFSHTFTKVQFILRNVVI